MALVIDNRVKETSTTGGTGTLDLAGAQVGFTTFVAGIGDTNTTYYTIFEQGTANYEIGIGTVTDAATDTAKINFGVGNTLDVFCTLPSEKAVYLDADGVPVGAASNGFAVAMAIAL